MQSYQISYAQEWKLGYAQKRIDALLRMLPELKEAGTIHIDAFKSIRGVRPAIRFPAHSSATPSKTNWQPNERFSAIGG
jgi:hypothetical protein